MSYFCRLFWTRLKMSLCTPAFWLGGLFFLLLITLLGATLSKPEPAGLQIGMIAQGETAQGAVMLLLDNPDYQVAQYHEAAQMQRDILQGKLHCGYLISDETDAQAPVTVWTTDASYMRPLLDQLVFAAYFEAGVPQMTKQYLEQLKIDGDGFERTFEWVKQQATPMIVSLKPLGNQSAPVLPEQANSVLPMLYAVMVSLFLAVCILKTLLEPVEIQQTLAHLRIYRPAATVCAPVCADLMLHLVLLIAADFSLGVLLREQNYPVSTRMAVLGLLAILTALLTVTTARLLKKWNQAVSLLLPVWLVGSVLLSGALISPLKLPAGLAVLRFLSPAWYALQILSG